MPELELGDREKSNQSLPTEFLATTATMHTSLPHYLLHAETYRSGHGAPRWKFALQSVGSEERLTAADSESTTRRSRLELLAVVRGLEALDRPSRVTLLTRSRYVSRGIRRQLAQWREHHWQWERFGEMTLIRDFDLWRRVDRALEIHNVECCVWQGDEGAAKSPARSQQAENWSVAATLGKLSRGVLSPLSGLWRPSFTRAA
jgi:ribonuclease HI